MRWSCCWRCFIASSRQRCSRSRSTWSWPYVIEWTCKRVPRTWFWVLPRIRSRSRRFRSHWWKQARLTFHRSFGHWTDCHTRPSRSCLVHRLKHEPSSYLRNSTCHWKLGRSLGKRLETIFVTLPAKMLTSCCRFTGLVQSLEVSLPPFSTCLLLPRQKLTATRSRNIAKSSNPTRKR